MENNLDKQHFTSIFSNPKIKIIFIAAFLLIILLFSIIIFSNFSTKQKHVSSPVISTTPGETEIPTEEKEEEKTRNAPRVYFRNYTNKFSPFSLPRSIKTYALKNNFSNNEVLDFAQKLGLKSYQQVPGKKNVLISDLEGIEKKGILSLNRETGSFYFESYGVLKPKNYKGENAITETQMFLQELGIYDNTISCVNTYQRKDMMPDVTFVECHRDWTKTEIPIINLGGILTLPENLKISDLTVGKTDKFSSENPVIVNVKDINANSLESQESKSRPDDFNTITLGIYKDGRILTITSNLRFITNEKILNTSEEIITLNEALTLFKDHKSQFSLTVPSGFGFIEWEKVYADNKAISDNAVINDISLVFIEKPNNVIQEEYKPYYLIRGTAILETGYTVKFVEAMPALKSDLLSLFKIKEVAGLKTVLAATGKPNLQLDTFNPRLSSTVKITPTHASAFIPPAERVECDLSNSIGEITLNIPGYGELTLIMRNAHTFFLKKTSATNDEIKNARRALYKAVQEQYKINVAKWVKDNNGYAEMVNLKSNLKTVEDVKTFFKGTISQIYDDTCNQIAIDPPLREAPYVCYIPSAGQGNQNKTPNSLTQEVTDEVAVWFLNELQKTGTAEPQKLLVEYSTKPDLFPEITLRNFHWVFILPRPVDEKYFKCILTAYSPSIFLYPEEKTNVSIKTGAPITYADPLMVNGIWNITANPEGTVEQNGVRRQNVYYEYDKSRIKFEEPVSGFIVETNKWKEFITNDLSKKLGLNSKETESLITEINNTIPNSPDFPYLKLSLIPQAELDQKLSLSINPKPDNIYRVNLFIKPMNTSENIKVPQINPIKRTGFTVVEIGAYTK